MEENMSEELLDLAKKIGINLNHKMLEQFSMYKSLLKEWNEKINLTAITDDQEIILKHFIDSLTIEKYLKNKSKMIDVGTGAGFPGIPLKIVREDINITLLDSLNKRLIFLEDVTQSLGLENVQIIHGRAEDLGNHREFREKYDIAVARAVANLAVLAEYCLPFVKEGGIFICMKGNNIEEIEDAKNAIEKLGGKIDKIDRIYLPDTNIERNIIVIYKEKSTPKGFPRKAGIPSKNPIK